MSPEVFQIVELIIRAIVVAFCAYLLPILKKWIETLIQNKWAEVAVKAAQQTLIGGAVKKEYAVELLKGTFDKWGVKITDEQISALIESAVNEYKGGYKKEE